MKKLLLVLPLISFFISGCSTSNKNQSDVLTHKADSLHNVIQEITKNEDNYIEIPFSKLISLFNSDSLHFDKSIKDIGFNRNENSILYFKDGFRVDTKGIGIGHFMFHNIPMIFRTYDVDWLTYTFPINRLSYYKTSILEKGEFTKLYEQEVVFIDKYNINFVREVYVDRISKLEYEVSYYKDYGKIRISTRNYW
ncbi:hypothetical protein D0T84_00935 [Dysgonomonas sp. 521]|uniref:hypothetical protein n=1 Tax=Dysgonomonas sp. 521 TaxID=2302932 RepID=UPI0013D73490|nr:hypothetical protein [Dysgonomonas sp. 521]NDV93483.1 hypothetical protein [Dysgonomonas sp. 521]